MTYKYITIISLMILGLAIWTGLLSYRTPDNPSMHKINLPDGMMENVTALIMDKEGNPHIKIVTPKMVHFAEDDTTHLISPHISLLYRTSPKPWNVTANYAKATQGIDNILLWDDVIIHHAADENNPATLIKTSTLMVHPNKKTAETDQIVTLIQPSLVVKATGMQANMDDGDIRLLSQARGEYVPSS